MDRMDDIWKDRFNGDELPVESWNSPDDLVWESVADQTVRKNKRRFAWWFWGLLASALLITALCFLTGANNGTATSINHGLSLQTENETQKINENNTTTAIVSEVETEAKEKTESVKEESLEKTSSNSNTEKIFNKPVQKSLLTEELALATKIIAATNETSILGATNKGETKLSTTPTNILSEENIISPKATNNQLTATAIDFSNMAIDLTTTNFLFSKSNFELAGQKIQKVKSKKGIFLSLNVGTTYWKHNISQQYTSDLSVADFNYTDNFGYLLDLDVDIPLGKRFMLQFGMDYEQANISSGHNSPLSYDPDLETNEANNGYGLTLATPYGFSAAEFSLTRSENIGEEPVDLLVDFHSAHTIKNFSLPIGIVYSPFGQKNKFSPYVKAGFGLNYLNGISNDIASIDTHHSAIQYNKNGNSRFEAPDIKQWHYDYRLGLGASYRFTPKLSLRIHYEYVNGINAIFKQDNYNTKINRHHLSVGLSRTLFDFP